MEKENEKPSLLLHPTFHPFYVQEVKWGLMLAANPPNTPVSSNFLALGLDLMVLPA